MNPISLLSEGMIFLGYFSELESDLTLALKIIVLLTIISFIIQHVGKGPLAIVMIIGISWFVIFDYFMFFGGMFALYVLVSFGATGILIDFFFVNPGGGGGGQDANEMTGVDLAKRQSSITQGRQKSQIQRMRGR